MASHEVLGDNNASVFVSLEFEKWSIVNHRVDKPTSADNESKNGDSEPNNLHEKDFVEQNNNLVEKSDENEKKNVFQQDGGEGKALLNVCSKGVVDEFDLFLGIVNFICTNQPFIFCFKESFSFGFSFQVHLGDSEVWNGEESVVLENLLDGFVLFEIVNTEEDFLLDGS